jgi:hypothetical protein
MTCDRNQTVPGCHGPVAAGATVPGTSTRTDAVHGPEAGPGDHPSPVPAPVPVPVLDMDLGVPVPTRIDRFLNLLAHWRGLTRAAWHRRWNREHGLLQKLFGPEEDSVSDLLAYVRRHPWAPDGYPWLIRAGFVYYALIGLPVHAICQAVKNAAQVLERSFDRISTGLILLAFVIAAIILHFTVGR